MVGMLPESADVELDACLFARLVEGPGKSFVSVISLTSSLITLEIQE
jgi:hypothetical protein